MPFDVRVEAILPQLDVIRPAITSAVKDVCAVITSSISSSTIRMGARITLLLCLAAMLSVAIQILKASEGLQSSLTLVFWLFSWAWILLLLIFAVVITLELARDYMHTSPIIRRIVRNLQRLAADSVYSSPSQVPQRVPVDPVDYTSLSDLDEEPQLEQYITAVASQSAADL
ncbi:Hypothetical protein GLP15_2108 [Giardia lamblia P15]|uniref:Uncharacterized protein n=1 Tax=Giardia intestinalis (strain P15) TaxID=658858 RepID=E1EY79_GIAIA|nr:Hypothetical protein GLP15_2108 [Giardia lamblia P15]